ncbi:CPBP family intramembrane metalloprotease [Streptococcus sp. NSJ-72]|uniref:CPBP family intramembrane glutamic endopeptidase n=1 Tax=Streptococcus sp. NSJ-72 TaxID=2763068 RepID=UPI00165183E5|nr:CPBP family intramembrane glutamic endopeptidase [Streptococcus sp. NSJ-72]QNL41463.1 CPBP family intramembrane metalloprotease [Streptococcus sp. NSJ-72]
MGRILLMYGAIHANVLLVSLFLMGWLDGIGLIVLQVAFLTFLLWFWKHYGIPKRNMPWIKRGVWLLGSFGVMVSIALAMSVTLSGIETNQQTVLFIQNQVPKISFILFLVNASVVEEVVYRELLWEKLTFPVLQVVLISFLFSLAHHPSSVITWFIYGSLGVTLGLVRLKTDVLMSTLVHLSWNGAVFLLSFL